MTKAYASTVINAEVGSVWKLVRDFGAVERWIPGCKGCQILEDSDSTSPVRRLTLGDDSVVDEFLVARDDAQRLIQYAFLPPLPMGMRCFIGTAHVLAVTDGERTFIEWMSEFDCDGDREERMVQRISSLLSQIVAAVGAEAEREANRVNI